MPERLDEKQFEKNVTLTLKLAGRKDGVRIPEIAEKTGYEQKSYALSKLMKVCKEKGMERQSAGRTAFYTFKA